MSPQTFRGYEARTIPTADLKIGDRMYFPGASMLLPIVNLIHQGDTVAIDANYESWGRGRCARIRRAVGGRSTIHVPVGDP